MPQTDTLQHLDQVTIIIVTYNSAHCLQAQVPMLSGAAHVMLVDNDSRDDTVATARALLLAHASVIKRPVVVWADGQITVGFDAADWQRRV